MTEKNRYVFGCFDTVEEVVDVIKHLKTRHLTNEDITLVTREDYLPQYSKHTNIKFATEEQVLNQGDTNASQGDNLWGKVTDAFAVESRTTKRPETNYRTDDDPLYSYQEQLDRGCVVVMVKGVNIQHDQDN